MATELMATVALIEQFADSRLEVAVRVGYYAQATNTLLDWFTAGCPSTPEDLEGVGNATRDAAAAVLVLEGVVTGLADAVRAATELPQEAA